MTKTNYPFFRDGDFDALAKLVYETNRAYTNLFGGAENKRAYEDAFEFERESIKDGITFLLDNPEAGPVESHDNWLAKKKADGWTYGIEKDIEKKTHPCMVSYGDLPAYERRKDYFFVGLVRAFTKNPST